MAGKGNLRHLLAKEVSDRPVRDIAHLVVLLHDLAARVADAAVTRLGHGIAGPITCAQVAVDAGPSFVAFAGLALSHRTVGAAS